VSGAYALARTIYTAQVRRRSDASRSLAGELADQARDAMRMLPRGA